MKIQIGLDPSVNNFGIAIRRGDELELLCFNIFEAGQFLCKFIAENHENIVKVVCEDNNSNSANFHQYKNKHMDSYKRAGVDRATNQRIGKAQAAQIYTEQLFKSFDIPLNLVSNRKRDRIDKKGKKSLNTINVQLLRYPTKTNREQFKLLLKTYGITAKNLGNNDSRDAATLILY